MASKMIVSVFALAMIATAMSQTCGCNSGVNYGLSGNNLVLSGSNLALSGNNFALSGNNGALSNGGGFAVISYSPLSPSGISVVSENTIDGNLDIIGALPVLSACGFEGQVPTTGQVAVQYGCGNGNIEITSQNAGATASYGGAASNSYSGLNNAVNIGYGAGVGNVGGCVC